MQEIAYYVILFRRQNGDLTAMAPITAESEVAAVGQAQFLVQEVAGAMVIGRIAGGDNAEAIEIIFKTGEVPETLSDLWTV